MSMPIEVQDPEVAVAVLPQSKGWARGIRKSAPRFALLYILVLLVVAFSIWLPDTFPTTGNLRAMVSSQAVLLLLALAVTLPLRTGDFDLSVGSVMVISSCTVSLLTSHAHWNPVLASVVAILIGSAVGLVNAFVIVVVGVNAFIATLGTLSVVEGISYALTKTQIVIGLPTSLVNFGRHEIFGLPAAAYYGWLLAFALLYVYQLTPFGRQLLFVGGNREASRLIGLKVDRIRAAAFVASAAISAFAGLVLASTLGAADPSIGGQYLLQPYAAAFLGTTVIQIGRFNVIGTVIGLYLVVVGVTGLQLLGASAWVSEVFYGGALVVSVGLAVIASRHRAA
jgi:ribose transport system permease protein